MRLAVRRKVGPKTTFRKNRPQPKNRKNENVVQQVNRKITKHINARNENIAMMKATGFGENVGALAIRQTRTAAERRLNLPQVRPGDKYMQKIRSLAGNTKAVKGGRLGKAKKKK
mmetsp:Transcript_47925/g.74848  ORF Transcript_47925/g.74848 Transcript_47925/m.74848 type:complete len:115 (+) Transcript_47925:671-1015(+)